MQSHLLYKLAKVTGVSLLFALTLTSCKGPWSKEFKEEKTNPNFNRPAITPIPTLNLNGNGGPKSVNVTLNDPDSALSCHEAISTHSSNINVVPATYMAVSGTPPNCVVTVTPAPGAVGTSDITLTVTDGKNVSATTFTVNAYGNPLVSATPVRTAVVGRAYAGFTVNGSGGLPPYTFAVASGTLPSGITLNASTGGVSGTPTAYGKFTNIAFRMTDADGGTATTSAFDLYVASYYIDLLTTTTLNPALSFARGSAGSNVGPTGNLQFFAPGNPRFEYEYVPGSPATITAKGLLVEEARTNLLRYSEIFEALAGTTATRAGVQVNVGLAPDNVNTTADKLREDNTAGNSHYLTLPAVAKPSSTALPYTFSIYAKASGRSALLIKLGNAGLANFAQGTCTLSGSGSMTAGTSTNFTNLGTSVKALANGWYRCSLSVITDAGASVQPEVRLLSGTSETYNGDNASGVLLWGAQLEAGRTVTSYIPARSFIDYSEELDGHGWTANNVTVTANSILAPDNSVTAEKVADTNNGQVGYLERALTIPEIAANYTFSIFVRKNSGAPVVALRMEATDTAFFGFPTGAVRAGFALNTVTGKISGMTGTTAPTALPLVQSVGNYWRVAFALTTTASHDSFSLRLYPAWSATLSGSGNDTSTNTASDSSLRDGGGETTGNAYFWGAQLEPSDLPAALTEYFKTTTVVSREADLVDAGSLPAGPFNTAEGALISEVNLNSSPNPTTPVVTFSDGTANNRMAQNFTSSLASFDLVSGGVSQVSATKAQAPSGIMKFAAGYKYNDLAIAVNGFAGGTSTSATVPVTNRIRFGRSEDGVSFLNGHLRTFTYFPDRVPNTLLPGLSNP